MNIHILETFLRYQNTMKHLPTSRRFTNKCWKRRYLLSSPHLIYMMEYIDHITNSSGRLLNLWGKIHTCHSYNLKSQKFTLYLGKKKPTMNTYIGIKNLLNQPDKILENHTFWAIWSSLWLKLLLDSSHFTLYATCYINSWFSSIHVCGPKFSRWPYLHTVFDEGLRIIEPLKQHLPSRHRGLKHRNTESIYNRASLGQINMTK